MADFDRRRHETYLITDAAEDPEVELRRREIRYVAMMLFRALCLVGAAIVGVQKPPLWGLWSALLVIGAVVIPWLAVIIANDRPPKKRQPMPTPQQRPQIALPQVPHDQVIDGD